MTNPRNVILIALLAIAAGYVVFWVRAVRRGPTRTASSAPGATHLGLGLVTNFFDVLGIGSFATTTTVYRLWRLVQDQQIPSTLNVGHALPTVVQALIYITIVQVEFRTLVLLILAAVSGSWFGAAIVTGMPRQQIQQGMGIALFAAAVLMVMTALDRFPGGGESLALTGPTLVLGSAVNFVLGALMTLGIGLYAPCMIMISLLGMNPIAAFPIMMGSCAFLMPTASTRFIRREKYDLKAAIGLGLGGMPGVVIAALIVRSLPLTYVRWLVVVVYAATSLLRASFTDSVTRQPAAV